MIKNMKLKLFLTNTVFRCISIINQIIPKNDKIVLLYSNMGFRDNIQYIYDYMILKGYNNKYKIIKSQNDKSYDKLPSNVLVENNLRSILTFLRAGHVFYCFGKLPIYPSKNQKVIQMWHGSPFKGADVRQKREMTKDYKTSYYTSVLSTAEIFNDFWGVEFDCGKQRIAICGQPRTDVMIEPYKRENIGLVNEKLILWMPTFRKSSILGYSDVKAEKDFLPVIGYDDIEMLNENLSLNNTKMIIKLHPMQDTYGITQTEYSNLCIYDHDCFKSKGYDLYRLLGNADALITDYSSVFLDYMLLSRPIGFTEDDIEDYSNGRGFAMSNPDHYRTGPKIRTFSDMIKFIESVSSGVDEWKQQRDEVNCEVNKFRDYNNRRRALEIGGVNL